MLQFLVIAALGYGGVVASLYLAQGWLVFPGSGLSYGAGRGPLLAEPVELEVGGGVTLHGRVFRSEGADDLVIGFGGNAQDAELLGQDLAARLPHAHVAVFHYRGYGPSEGDPSEAALLEDALSIHDHLAARLRPARTFAVGVSLGSAVATFLSKHRRLDGLVLVTPFDSIEAIARESYPWIPVGLLLKHRFPSHEFVAGNATPVAVIAAAEDQTVRPERTRALIEQIETLVYEATVEDATHNTILALDAYDTAFREAFAALAAAAGPRIPGETRAA
ncbi:MAG TPA: alpha/beta fold hydrolase, partial [Geminicoccaceae bacterium]